MRRWFFARKPDAGFVLTQFPATLLQARVFDEWLDARGVRYETLDVIRNAAARREMHDLTGQSRAPSIDVDGNILADFGADIGEERAAAFSAAARAAIPGAEVELQQGGQPIERVLVSLE